MSKEILLNKIFSLAQSGLPRQRWVYKGIFSGRTFIINMDSLITIRKLDCSQGIGSHTKTQVLTQGRDGLVGQLCVFILSPQWVTASVVKKNISSEIVGCLCGPSPHFLLPLRGSGSICNTGERQEEWTACMKSLKLLFWFWFCHPCKILS